MDRYKQVIKESRVPVDSSFINSEIERISEKIAQYRKPEILAKIYNSIDLTTLSTEDSQHSVTEFVKKVNDFDNEYPQFPNVAAI